MQVPTPLVDQGSEAVPVQGTSTRQPRSDDVVLPGFLDCHLKSLLLEDGSHITRHMLGNLDSKTGGVRMRSNDYLNIANHKEIAEARTKVMLEDNTDETISRVFAHSEDENLHRKFERRIAKIFQAEDAVLTMSGYHANSGLLNLLCVKGTRVFIDKKAHMSLWVGLQHTGAKVFNFRHNDAKDLEAKVEKNGSGIIIVDSLYSTDGSICPLVEIADIATRSGSALVVDETHAFGCARGGAGLCEELGISSKVHFRTVGFSKAIPARGGAIVGPTYAMEAFRYVDKQMIFSTQLLNFEVAGLDKALDVVEAEAWRRERLHDNHKKIKAGLLALGYDVSCSDRQIIAIYTGGNADTIGFRDALADQGVYGSVFCPPATPPNDSLIRFTVHAGLTAADIEKYLTALEAVRPLLKCPRSKL